MAYTSLNQLGLERLTRVPVCDVKPLKTTGTQTHFGLLLLEANRLRLSDCCSQRFLSSPRRGEKALRENWQKPSSLCHSPCPPSPHHSLFTSDTINCSLSTSRKKAVKYFFLVFLTNISCTQQKHMEFCVIFQLCKLNEAEADSYMGRMLNAGHGVDKQM